MSWEREFYVVTCLQCGEAGTALWEQNDGPSFLRDPYTAVSVSNGFSLQSVGPIGCEPFFGRSWFAELVVARPVPGDNTAAADVDASTTGHQPGAR
jgi:hypothetical protein